MYIELCAVKADVGHGFAMFWVHGRVDAESGIQHAWRLVEPASMVAGVLMAGAAIFRQAQQRVVGRRYRRNIERLAIIGDGIPPCRPARLVCRAGKRCWTGTMH